MSNTIKKDNHQNKDYKTTLLMPQTDFEMRANLTEKEVHFKNFWLKNQIHAKVLKERKNNHSFILHDGPPYANGDLHIGHALNKILKDIVVRYKTLSGFYSPFILGWDTHGLPIENKMLEALKMTKDDLDPVALRQKAKEYAQTQIENQKRQFESMQLFTDYSTYYKTFDSKYETNELRVLKKMLINKLIYKGLKPIYWSWSSQSALAEAEIEYKQIKSPQVYVKFRVKNFKDFPNLSLIIMTTTPWTLVANAGVAVGENLEYSIIEINKNEHWIIGTKLVKNVLELSKIKNYKILKTLIGKDLLNLIYNHPLNKFLNCPIILGHHVSMKEGTGLVHIAPLFGEDDYEIGVKHNLNNIMHVDEKGVFNQLAGEYEGLFYLKANNKIIEDLTSQDDLIINQTINHSYPHDWRTHKPIIYRASEQWFFATTKIKHQIIKAIKKVKSIPDWGINRLENMVINRESWTISRQRTWGLPIIIFYDQNDNPIIQEDTLDYVIDLIEKHGSDIWWTKNADELLPQKYRGKGWKKEYDILDVWFDSGCSFLIPELKGLEIDLYLEGSDQYRGWFNSSLINSVVYQDKAPFNTLLSHGFVLDEKNQKMSKSLGNIIDPLTIIKKHGADILRLWVASVEYTSDVTVSENIINQVSLMYRNLRTKIRFMLGNLFDFNPNKNYVNQLKDLDALIKEKLNNLKFKVKTYFDNYEFHHGLREINQFISDLSSYYFEVNKDTLYVEEANNISRRSVQTNLYEILSFTLKILSIFLPTTCEEAYQGFNCKNKKTSIFFETESFATKINHQETNKWKEFFDLKDHVYKMLEEAKKQGLIKRSQTAWVVLSHEYKKFQTWNLTKLLMVGKVTFENNNQIKLFEGQKCLRCWNHFDWLNKDSICQRCENVLIKQENLLIK